MKFRWNIFEKEESNEVKSFHENYRDREEEKKGHSTKEFSRIKSKWWWILILRAGR